LLDGAGSLGEMAAPATFDTLAGGVGNDRRAQLRGEIDLPDGDISKKLTLTGLRTSRGGLL
jgi:hypothetical protein